MSQLIKLIKRARIKIPRAIKNKAIRTWVNILREAIDGLT